MYLKVSKDSVLSVARHESYVYLFARVLSYTSMGFLYRYLHLNVTVTMTRGQGVSEVGHWVFWSVKKTLVVYCKEVVLADQQKPSSDQSTCKSPRNQQSKKSKLKEETLLVRNPTSTVQKIARRFSFSFMSTKQQHSERHIMWNPSACKTQDGIELIGLFIMC